MVCPALPSSFVAALSVSDLEDEVERELGAIEGEKEIDRLLAEFGLSDPWWLDLRIGKVGA